MQPSYFEIHGLIGAGKTTLLVSVGGDTMLDLDEVVIHAEEEADLSMLIMSGLSAVYSSKKPIMETDVVVEGAFASLRAISLLSAVTPVDMEQPTEQMMKGLRNFAAELGSGRELILETFLQTPRHYVHVWWEIHRLLIQLNMYDHLTDRQLKFLVKRVVDAVIRAPTR